MRKYRIIYWVISIIISIIIIEIYNAIKSQIPYEEREPIYVYCPEEFQRGFKDAIEKSSSLKGKNRVIFTENKSTAQIILTDTIIKSEVNQYEKVGWSPMIAIIDDSRERSYRKSEYISGKKMYTMDINKIIEDSISGTFTDKIHVPTLDTKEGELFFDMLLININNGRYPSETEIDKITEKANEFLNCSNVIPGNPLERLNKSRIAVEEIYFILEYEVYFLNTNDVSICYPCNTVVCEWYLGFFGDDAEILREAISKSFGLSYKYIRTNANTYHDSRYLNVSKGFPYVEIPLKDEQ